jgi:hypothetical protein
MGLIPILPIFAVSSGYTLPTTLGHATTSTGIGLVGLIVSGVNIVIGIGGLIAIAYGVLRIIKLLIAQYQGKSSSEKEKYSHGFVHEGALGTMPPLMKAMLDILVGFIIIGLFMSGAWVAIIDHLIVIGSHVGNTLANHIGNSTGSGSGTVGT